MFLLALMSLSWMTPQQSQAHSLVLSPAIAAWPRFHIDINCLEGVTSGALGLPKMIQ